MARPLRIDVEGGWYHTMSRGIERRSVFLSDRHCEHFLELLEEMSERYGVEVHAYVLMDNHYHLLVKTPAGNLSAAMQWLNVSYSAWLNAKEGRVGHVFQGRFRATLVDGDGAWLLQASAYLHLNPVRRECMGLSKTGNKAEATGLVKPDREVIRKRLAALREHGWSSYRAYAGYSVGPPWLNTEELLKRSGGHARYRRYVQRFVTRGLRPEAFDTLKERVAIGGVEFLKRAKVLVGKTSREQPDKAFVRETVPFERIVKVVEDLKQEPWERFAPRYGDWGRDLALYLARKRSGMTLRQIGEAAGGLDYKAVNTAIRRFAPRLESDRRMKTLVLQCMKQLTIVET